LNTNAKKQTSITILKNKNNKPFLQDSKIRPIITFSQEKRASREDFIKKLTSPKENPLKFELPVQKKVEL